MVARQRCFTIASATKDLLQCIHWRLSFELKLSDRTFIVRRQPGAILAQKVGY
nr:MAG TPA: hypothetical protein [Caudoviricetes sp.]